MDNDDAVHPCPACGKSTFDLRIELLGVVTCVQCTPQPTVVYGLMDYSHKTGGVLQIINDKKMFDKMKKPINQQR